MTVRWFHAFAKRVSRFTGGPLASGLAFGSVVAWVAAGPIFHYSEMWQLVFNTVTSVVTFLMVFLIQNAQNRDTEALQVKLDELIRATEGAQNSLLDLEELDPEELAQFRRSYTRLASRAKDPTDDAISPSGVEAVELEGMPRTTAAAPASPQAPDTTKRP